MEHFIEVKRHARYFLEGNTRSKNLLVVLHGYSQLAKYFIRKFDIAFEDWCVVAPEGMNRFYTQGHSGRVGASWMTKEAREYDILDNVAYLDALITDLSTNYLFDQITILGFSQGAATAARYFYSPLNKATNFIVWASVLPPDLDKENLFNAKLDDKKRFFVLGTEDEFFNENQQQEVKQFFEKLQFEVLTFEGKHDIDSKTLGHILEKL